MWKYLLIVLIAVIAIGCSAQEAAEARSANEYAAESDYAGSAAVAPDEGAGELGTRAPGVEDKPGMKLAVQNAPQPTQANVRARKVIRNASITVRVDDVEKSEDAALGIVNGAGGFMESAESTDLMTSSAQIVMKLRVPVQTFDSVLSKLEGLGTRISKKVSGEDVTAQIVDYEARLKTMRAQEETYRRMLQNSRTLQDSVELQNQLMSLRGEIESLDAQRQALSELAALSTIEVTLLRSAASVMAATNEEGSWAKETWASATTSGMTALRFLGTIGIWAIVFAPIWVPVLLFARIVWRNVRRPELV